jgi:hypothetical protein
MVRKPLNSLYAPSSQKMRSRKPPGKLQRSTIWGDAPLLAELLHWVQPHRSGV